MHRDVVRCSWAVFMGATLGLPARNARADTPDSSSRWQPAGHGPGCCEGRRDGLTRGNKNWPGLGKPRGVGRGGAGRGGSSTGCKRGIGAAVPLPAAQRASPGCAVSVTPNQAAGPTTLDFGPACTTVAQLLHNFHVDWIHHATIMPLLGAAWEPRVVQHLLFDLLPLPQALTASSETQQESLCRATAINSVRPLLREACDLHIFSGTMAPPLVHRLAVFHQTNSVRQAVERQLPLQGVHPGQT